MRKFTSILVLIGALWFLTNCSGYRPLVRGGKSATDAELAARIRLGKFYKIELKDGNTAFIQVKRVEGVTIYGKLRKVNEKYYPVRDSAGKKILEPMGSVNLGDAKRVEKRKSIVLAVTVAVVLPVAFFVWLGSLGPWSGD